MNNETSPEPGAMPAPGPATGPASPGATPEQKPGTQTLEEALAQIAELKRQQAESDHALKNATEERDRHRKKLSGYEDAERKAQEAQLSEIEKATKGRTEAEARAEQYRQQLVTASVKLAAQAKGIIDPDLAALAIQQELEYDEYGMPNNVEKALEKLVKNKPYLLAQQAQQQAPTNTPARGNAAPAVPAMNPGRTTIVPPDSIPPGKLSIQDAYSMTQQKR